MKRPIRTKTALGMVVFAALALVGGMAWAQGPAPAASAGAGGDILRIRRAPSFTTEKTPIYTTRGPQQTSARQPDWGRVVLEFETSADWVDELEFTYFVYLKDQSARGAEIMYRGVVTYMNVAKGRHLADIFLHPSTLARLGRPEQIAVVVKHRGAVIASESTARTPNWWERFPPIDGVLLNRAQTPFVFMDYDAFNLIKPATPAR